MQFPGLRAEDDAMALLIRIDGVTHRERATATVSLYDHGFLFGDSVYEVVRTWGGRIYELGPHLARLYRSAGGLSLDIGRTKEELAREIESALRDAGCAGEAYVRVIVTRGVGEIDIDPASCGQPTTVIVVKDLSTWPPEQYAQGVDAAIVSVVRNELGTIDPSLKTGNYLNSILALIEAKKRGAKEAILLNPRGHVTECTTSNIFFARDGIVYTPALESGILEGVTRSTVLRCAREGGVPVREGLYGADLLRTADEAFISSTTRGVMPIGTIDGRPVGMGEGARPLLARLAALLDDDVKRFMEDAARSSHSL